MRKKVIIVITMLSFLFTACGRQVTERQPEQKEETVSEQDMTEKIKWSLQEIELPDADAALADMISKGGKSPSEQVCGMVGETIYRIVTLYGFGLDIVGTCIQRLEPPYMSWENTPILNSEWTDSSYCYVRAVALGQDGSVHMLLKDNENYYMARWMEETGFVVDLISDEYLSEEFLSGIAAFYVDGDNTSYFATSGGLEYFDAEFSEKKQSKSSDYIWQITENAAAEETVYLCGSSIDGRFRIWTIADKEPIFSSEDVFMSFTDKVVFANETEGFLCNTDGIWTFELENKQMEERITFREQGYTVSKVCGATIKADGTLMMLVVIDGEHVLLKSVEDKGWQDKVELELATLVPTPFLQEAIIDFNKNSDSCHINLRVPAEGEEYSDFKTRIQAEISSGGGPALFTNYVVDLTTGVEKGILRNLTEDFAEKKDEMLENVRAIGEVNGECYAIPYSFGVNTLVISADMVGEKESWNYEEMMQCVQSGEAEAVVSCYEGAALFDVLTMYANAEGGLVDWENKKSYLNSERALSLLNFAREYGDMGDWSDRGLRIVEGEVLTILTSMVSLDEAQSMEALFQGKEVYIGFPVENRENGNIVWGDTIAINQACEYQEEAVAFIRYLLEEETQNKLAKDAYGNTLGSSGFPVHVNALENMFLYAEEQQEDSHESTIIVNYGGYEYEKKALTADSLEKLQKLLYNAKPAASNTSAISDIIWEETPAYFSGEKSGKEVLDIVQNRAQLYLDEN